MRNVVIVTARLASERLPGKALIDVEGCPNLARIVNRFRQCKQVSEILVATTLDASDDPIRDFCEQFHVRCFRGHRNDVTARVYHAAKMLQADYILRATTDAPFISAELVDAAFAVVGEHKADSGRIWGMPDRGVPVYGAAEFPYSMAALSRMHAESLGAEREHVGMHLDANRLKYQVIYPIAPCSYSKAFYRPYRLELDTPDDLKLVRHLVGALGDTPPLQQVVRYLDAHPEVAQINSHISERTGPMTSFTPEQRAQWKHQQALHTVEWGGNWQWLMSGSPAMLPKGTQPLYCAQGVDYLGYVERGADKVHRLHTPDGNILTGRASLSCSCGAGRQWYHDAKARD